MAPGTRGCDRNEQLGSLAACFTTSVCLVDSQDTTIECVQSYMDDIYTQRDMTAGHMAGTRVI